MEVNLSKQAQKYMSSVNENTRRTLYKALDGLKRFEGDIVRLKGLDNTYRLKIPHYRIVFRLEGEVALIYVIEINTRTNIKYREYRKK